MCDTLLPVRPPLCAIVRVAEAFRAAALSAFHATTGSKESFLLSGHLPNGSADTQHRHAYYLPQPTNDVTLGGIIVVSPYCRFSEEELATFHVVKAIRWNGPSTTLRLELIDLDDQSWNRVACRWVSATPYVPIRRFWGTHGKHHLTPERQLDSEVKTRVPTCSLTEISLASWCECHVRASATGNRDRSGNAIRRDGYRARFHVDQPICGPVAIGHSCHFGLGQFVPEES